MVSNLLFDMFIKKSIEIDLNDLNFKSTNFTKFRKYGDFYTKLNFHDYKICYIIDYHSDDEQMNELSPNGYVINIGTSIKTEIIIFDKLYQDDVKIIIGYHNDSDFLVHLSDGENTHHINGPSVYHYKQKNKSFDLFKKEYYIRGIKFENELQFERYIKIKKIRYGRK